MSSLWGINDTKIKILDCTIRDGGLVNDHHFSVDFVKAVYQGCVAAGVDYMEIGYKHSDKIFAPEPYGLWKFCKEDDIRRVVGDNPSDLKLACMIDAGKSDWKTDVVPRDKSPLDMIRVAFYHYQTDEAVAMIEDAYEKGYEVSANLMAVTTIDEVVLDRVLERLVKTPAATIVIVDSFGSLTPFQTEYLTRKYLNFAQSVDKEVGMHAHNNLQLAFANTLEAAKCGATRLDASFAGLGRGAGNCPIEFALSVVNADKYRLRPVYGCLEDRFVQLAKEIEWGAFCEYSMTAQHNVHPRAAIAARKDPTMCNKFTAFYDMLEEEAAKQEGK